jgi:hypothetical protein
VLPEGTLITLWLQIPLTISIPVIQSLFKEAAAGFVF